MDGNLVFNPVAYYRQQAQQAMEEGDFRAAGRAFKQALRHLPNSPADRARLLVELGDSYFEGHRYQAAITTWQTALETVETTADRPWILWRVAKAYARRKLLDEAEALLSGIPQSASRLDRLLRAQIQCLKGEILRQRKNFPASKRILRAAIRTALAIHPEDSQGVVIAAYEALFRTCRAADDLVMALKVLLEAQPHMAAAGEQDDLTGPLTDLGIALIRRDRPRYAEKAFASALACSDDPTTEVYLLSNYASVLCEVGQFDDAFLYVQKAIAYADVDDPQSPEFLATLFDTAAYICLRRNQVDAARMWIQKALTRLAEVPSSPFPVASVYLNLALIEEETGRLDEALMALYQAQAHQPGSRHLQREIDRLKKRIEKTTGKARRNPRRLME
ncbi:MAG: tetratricopeptide repeat protein [Candidatus Sericytochromatia bacterium]|nr:tetratricopeptide repeat protein [Candidatus Sericytochromatia bacterium]